MFKVEKRRWADLSTTERASVATMALVQLALAVTAWVDLARRPAAEVNGSKRVWGLVIGLNFVGPLAYFARGRRSPAAS